MSPGPDRLTPPAPTHRLLLASPLPPTVRSLTQWLRERAGGRWGPAAPRRVVTASLQSRRLRILVGSTEQIELWAEEPLAPAALHSPGGADAQEVARAIGALRERNRLPGQGWAVAIQAPRAVARVLELPRIPPRHLGRVVLREARKEFPLSLDEVYFYWTPLPPSGNGVQVFTVGVPRKSIDGHLEAFELAGVKVAWLTLHPLALARAGSGPSSMHLNVDDGTMTLVILRAGVPVVVRVLPLDEAQSAVTREDTLIQELTRTVRFHNENGGRQALSPSTIVELSGSLTDPGQLPRIRDRIRQSLGYGARPFQPTMAVPEGFPAHLYAPNLGLLHRRP